MKSIALAIIILTGLGAAGGFSLAHGTGAAGDGDNHTGAEEAEGRIIWNRLQSGEEKCANLSDGDFAALGEYFMGGMSGPAHQTMNDMMTRALGGEGEVEMHAAMGKRLSGCDSGAAWSKHFIPNPMGRLMMGNFGAGPMWWGGMGWLFTITWLVWLAVGILAAVWLWQRITKK